MLQKRSNKWQMFIEINRVSEKTSKLTNDTKFAGIEKCIYIKYHMPSHA